jgi:hypothetical protein
VGVLERAQWLAIATARTSRKIDGVYQNVLVWARQLGSAAGFFARLARPGSANDDMRTFVQTLRGDLRDAGAPHDDETVWKTLARLQILIFDFTNNGSATEELARDRAAHVLPPEDRAKAASLWSTLTEFRRRCGVSVAQTLQESDWPMARSKSALDIRRDC